jgi:hypothetical protein
MKKIKKIDSQQPSQPCPAYRVFQPAPSSKSMFDKKEVKKSNINSKKNGGDLLNRAKNTKLKSVLNSQLSPPLCC